MHTLWKSSERTAQLRAYDWPGKWWSAGQRHCVRPGGGSPRGSSALGRSETYTPALLGKVKYLNSGYLVHNGSGPFKTITKNILSLVYAPTHNKMWSRISYTFDALWKRGSVTGCPLRRHSLPRHPPLLWKILRCQKHSEAHSDQTPADHSLFNTMS